MRVAYKRVGLDPLTRVAITWYHWIVIDNACPERL